MLLKCCKHKAIRLLKCQTHLFYNTLQEKKEYVNNSSTNIYLDNYQIDKTIKQENSDTPKDYLPVQVLFFCGGGNEVFLLRAQINLTKEQSLSR